jgi:hypothetical protein
MGLAYHSRGAPSETHHCRFCSKDKMGDGFSILQTWCCYHCYSKFERYSKRHELKMEADSAALAWVSNLIARYKRAQREKVRNTLRRKLRGPIKRSPTEKAAWAKKSREKRRRLRNADLALAQANARKAAKLYRSRHPDVRELERKRSRDYRRKNILRLREKDRLYAIERRKDPAYREKQRAYMKEYAHRNRLNPETKRRELDQEIARRRKKKGIQ